MKKVNTFFYTLWLCFLVFSLDADEKKEDKALNDFMIRLETGALDSRQVKGIKQLAKSKEQNVSVRAVALYSRYLCECENQPDKALAKAEKLLDSEKYGPEFVAYRTAREHEFTGDFLRAVVFYERIIREYPDTVYSEAAELYGAKCLLLLSEKTEMGKAEQKLANFATKTQENAMMLKKYADRISQRILAQLEAQTREDENLLIEMKKVPLGKNAAERAVAKLENFISKNEFGLYRGEALLALGDHYLENKVDIDMAFYFLNRAKNWLEKVESMNTDTSRWSVPSRAVCATAPPASDKTLVGWNANIASSPRKPEQIINRTTAPWYLDSLRARTDKALSFLNYLKGDGETAIKLAESILKYEPLERQFQAGGEPNTYQRMLFCYGRGWLYARPEELNLFKEKLRTAVQLAEFYYIQEEWAKCMSLRQDILDGKFGKLNKEQKAVMIYRVADVSVWFYKKDNTAIEMLDSFLEGEYKGTYIRPHALVLLGSLCGKQLKDKKGVEKAIRCYIEALKELKDDKSNLADRARSYMITKYYRGLGDIHNVEGAYEKALEICRDLLKKSDSAYRNICLNKMREIEKRLENKKRRTEL